MRKGLRGAFAAGLGLLFVGMAVWSWGKWPDLRLDFGDELYVPWQLTTGRVLYRDIAHLYGPLSKYLNAGVFAVFGVGLNRLVFLNLGIASITAALLAHLGHKAAGVTTAVLVPLVFITAFAFAQYGLVGNFNWICPYRHEAVHGTALGLAAVALIARHARTGGLASVALAGLCVGGALLTKPEIAAAAVAAAAVGAVLIIRATRSIRSGLALAAGVALPPVAAGIAFVFAGFSPGNATRAALGAFVPLISGAAASTPFFARSAGLDHPAMHFEAMLLASIGAGVLAAVVVFVDLRVGSMVRGRRLAASAVVVFAILLGLGLHWYRAEYFLTPLLVIATLVCCWRAWFLLPDSEAQARAVLHACSCVFAVAMLGKILLWPRIMHFGFVLALPATCVCVACAVDLLPGWLNRLRPGSGKLARAAAISLVLVFCLRCFLGTRATYANKTLPVGTGPDAFVAYDPKFTDADIRIVQALEALRVRATPTQTLAVLPEGIMINYLLRLRNPTPFTILSTTELAQYGEAAVLRSYREHPPDLILWVSQDASELGVGPFGADPRYGAALAQWTRSAYAPIWIAGGDPLAKDDFEVQLLQRQ